jgi:glycosyltransferase involved in cell wall biosynthesis
MPSVHQLVPTFAPRSWTSDHTLQVQAVLRGLGYESDIYVGDAWREIAHHTKPYRDLPGRRDGWLLYQASTGSPIADWLQQRPERLLMNWHNITPASFFAPWEPHVGVELAAGRRQIADLAAHTELAICDSAYNEEELVALGYRRTEVVPILLDTSTFGPPVERAAPTSGATWVYVSRISPNKAHHDLLKAFTVYRRVYDAGATFRIIGGLSSHRYGEALRELATALRIDDAVEWLGDASDGAKHDAFRDADVFVCLSDHEGFSIPLLEAMHHRVPIVAYGSTAVPETLGDGGILLATKEPTRVAAAVHRVVSDAPLRAALVEQGAARLRTFDLESNKRRFGDAVRAVV